MSSTIRRALVTGANGFIGGALTRRLLAEGVTVRAMCRAPEKGRHLTGAEVVRGDVQDAARLRELATDCDLVFHVAAISGDSAPVHYRVNVGGSENVALAAHAAGAARLVHVSSVAVYGLPREGFIFESHPQTPSARDFYGQSKMLGEAAVWRVAERTGLPTTVVRPAFVYGPGSSFWSLALYKLAKRLPLLPDFGTGSAHPIYIDDLIDLLLILATHPAAPGNAYNASADPPVPWHEYLGLIGQIADRGVWIKLPTETLARLARPIEAIWRLSGTPEDVSGTLRYLAGHCTYRIDKARDQLGWRPRVSLADGMAETARWLRGM
jgi:nucleoside-diphosphate-sugar epimerase